MTTSSPIVEVVLNGTHVPIDRDVFASLFHNSVVARRGRPQGLGRTASAVQAIPEFAYQAQIRSRCSSLQLRSSRSRFGSRQRS